MWIARSGSRSAIPPDPSVQVWLKFVSTRFTCYSSQLTNRVPNPAPRPPPPPPRLPVIWGGGGRRYLDVRGSHTEEVVPFCFLGNLGK